MTTPATVTPATGAQTTTTPADANTNPDGSPKSPKQIASEKFKAETAELVARDAKEREKSQRDSHGRFKPGSEPPKKEQKQATQPEEKAETTEQTERKIWKLKVDGADVDFDATDEENVKRAIQKAYAADKRMNQAALTTKQAEKFIELLKTNPRAVLSHPSLGVDLKKLGEQIVWEDLQAAAKNAGKTKEDFEREAEKAELEKFRNEKAEREAEQKQIEKDQLKEKYRQDWAQKFQSELEKAGLPKTDWTLTRMAQYMRQALAKGHKHVQPGDVVEYVREDWATAQREMFGHLDGEALIKTLGEDVAEKVRKAQLAKFQGGGRTEAKAEVESKQPPRRFTSVEDMMRDTPRKK